VSAKYEERRRVATADQVEPGEPVATRSVASAPSSRVVGSQARLGPEHVPLGAPGRALGLDDDVVDVGADGHREVARQGPRWSSRPDLEGEVAGLEAERHGDGRVLAVRVGVVHADLEVGQRRLGAPAVRQAPGSLVDQALVPQLLNAQMTDSM
jgi:hypothetical protein